MEQTVHFHPQAPHMPRLSEAYEDYGATTTCGVDNLTRDRWLTRDWQRVTCKNCLRRQATVGASKRMF